MLLCLTRSSAMDGRKYTIVLYALFQIFQAVHSLSLIPRDSERCDDNNGGCEQICKDFGYTSYCSCNEGYELQLDSASCLQVNHHEYNSPEGRITCFPRYHRYGFICTWLITTTPGQQIELVFQDIREFEGNYYSLRRPLSIYDGDSARYGSELSWCDPSIKPCTVITPGNQVYIRFQYWENIFFREIATYKTVNNFCGTNSRPGEISSPNYPNEYSKRIDCKRLFTAAPGHRIKLVFQDFDLEYDERCSHDNVTVYDGNNKNFPVLGTFCGSTLPDQLIASGNSMYLEFKSDNSIERTGFNATYTTVCGGRLLDDKSDNIFHSHVQYGDQNYDDGADCLWILQGQENEKILLQFLKFDLEPEEDCSNDYVEVYDRRADTDKSYGKYCGKEDSFAFLSSGNTLMVHFRSNDNVTAEGFSAKWKAIDFSQSFSPSILCS